MVCVNPPLYAHIISNIFVFLQLYILLSGQSTDINTTMCLVFGDFTVGSFKVLLTTTTGCLDSLTYMIQPYAH
jgi:hypothetical protein